MPLREWEYPKPFELSAVRKMLAGPNWIIDLKMHDILTRVIAEYDELKAGPVVAVPVVPNGGTAHYDSSDTITTPMVTNPAVVLEPVVPAEVDTP